MYTWNILPNILFLFVLVVAAGDVTGAIDILKCVFWRTIEGRSRSLTCVGGWPSAIIGGSC